MVDGNPDTRWTTGEKQKDGQWIEIDLHEPGTINLIVFDTAGSRNDYPRQLLIEGYSEAGDFIELPMEQQFSGEITRLVFPPEVFSKLRITQTGDTDHWFWSIHELHVGYIDP